MRYTVQEFIKSCKTKEQIKARSHKPYGLLQPIEPPKSKREVVNMDLVLPLPETENENSGMLNVVDKLSKMMRIIAIKSNINPPEVAIKFKDYIYRNNGLPNKVISDRDGLFMSKFCKVLFYSLGTKLAPSTAYHPQTDGQSEISNRKVEEIIRAFANYKRDNWDDRLVDFEIAYISAVNSTTLCSPFLVNYGIHSRTIPINVVTSNNPSEKYFFDIMQDLTKFAHDRIVERNKKMDEYANKSTNPHTISVDEQAWLSTKNLSIEVGSGMRKLHPKFCGPFKIIEKINEVTFRLALSEPIKARGIHYVFHCSLFEQFVPDQYGRYDRTFRPVDIQDGIEECEVETILDSRKIGGKQHFLVKWKGYDNHENTWQTKQDLENA